MAGQQPTKPVLAYARPGGAKVRTGQEFFLLAPVGLVLVFMNVVTTSCMCGHMSWVSLAANLVGLGMALFALWKVRRKVLSRVLCYPCVVVPALVLLQNIHNVLWSGHDPLLR